MKRNTIASLGLIALLVTGCETMSTTGRSTAGGAAVGAAAGGILASGGGGMSGAEGAIVGGLVGGLLGHHSGKQKQENQDLEAQLAEANTRVVSVHNSNGSTTPVTLHRVNGKWQGPRGEQYDSVPSESQLAPVYGM